MIGGTLLEGRMNLFCVVLTWWLRAITHLSKPIVCTTLRVTPKLWTLVNKMCQCWLIIYNQCIILMQDVNTKGNWWGEY